ncbi:MAG TPA: tRNA lysidine(34) synthetase TilS, partial [Terriglobia bacterium]|nr:tRNA lysidine(34) synthetase TilS [Terriglobia bacterium]
MTIGSETPFIHKVQETISRYRMLHAHDRALVGVSGGADSTALLLALHELGYSVAAAHLNHRLRGTESDSDEEFVRVLSRTLGVPFLSKSVEIRAAEGNLEAAGREARRQFFRELQDDHKFSKIALAHNREDRIETFLLNLMRGAGLDGLVSMGPVSGHTIRPFIDTSREEIEAFLRDRGQAWRTDRTNLDMSFARNRLRHEVLPRLASLFNARLTEAVTRTLHVLQDEDEWMNEIAETWLIPGGEVRASAARLRDAPVALVRRVIRQGLRRAGSDLTNVTFDHIEAIRSLLEAGKSGKTIQLPRGYVAAREFDQLLFSQVTETKYSFSYELPIPGTVRVPELGRVFRATFVPNNQVHDGHPPEGKTRVLVDGDRLDSYVRIRN